mmetsp:Transcript_36642/g.57208  ORF Transcript_36642/g.57208 Transcript_36642/m.57208 type:complete len:364 (+) Transcript_36642:31-1122(+)
MADLAQDLVKSFMWFLKWKDVSRARTVSKVWFLAGSSVCKAYRFLTFGDKMFRGTKEYKKDLKKAAQSYRRAAELGCPKAANKAGLAYTELKKYEDALAMFNEAAKKGDTYGEANLASAYFHGRGTVIDQGKAVQLYIRSAKKGNGRAMCSLSRCFLEGAGCRRSAFRARRWAERAAEAGHARAQYTVAMEMALQRGCAAEEGKGTGAVGEGKSESTTSCPSPKRPRRDERGRCPEKRPSPQLEFFHTRETVRLLELSAKQGYAKAQFELAGLLWVGMPWCPRDPAAARGWAYLAGPGAKGGRGLAAAHQLHAVIEAAPGQQAPPRGGRRDEVELRQWILRNLRNEDPAVDFRGMMVAAAADG